MSPAPRTVKTALGVAIAFGVGAIGCEKLSTTLDAGTGADVQVPPLPSTVPAPKPAPPAAIAPLGPGARTEDEANTISVFKVVGASAAFVTQKRAVFDYFAGRVEVPAGSGSGFVWDDA